MSPFVLDVVDGVRVSEHSGDLLHRPPTEWNGHPLTCHCYKGRCGSCMAIEGDDHPCHNCDGNGHPIVDECPDCVDGHLLVARRGTVRVSVQAVPIEHNAASPRTQPHVAVSTVYEPNGEAFLWIDADKQVVEVDIGPEPLSQVGRFAIIATPEGDDQ